MTSPGPPFSDAKPNASDAMPETTAPVDEQAIRERLERVQERIAAACARAGRSPDEVTLVAVSKTFPLEAIEAARAAGLRHFGENRARELRDKARALPGAVENGDVHWHMIGHLQTNKAKFVARHADLFSALDSLRLAEELDQRAQKNERVLPCLVQVNISGEGQKYGVAADDVHAFLDELAAYDHLEILGLMAMAAYADDPEASRPAFRQMRRLFETYDASKNPRVRMQALSTGMTNDFEVAIEEGATQVRLGSALFGPRGYD